MTYQTVDEQIDVAVIYKKGEVRPVAFKWGARKYRIVSLNLVHSSYEGATKNYFFSVSAKNGGEYKLKYNTDNMRWFLDEIYME